MPNHLVSSAQARPQAFSRPSLRTKKRSADVSSAQARPQAFSLRSWQLEVNQQFGFKRASASPGF